MKKIFNHINLSLWLLALFCLPAHADQIDYAVTFSSDSVHVTQMIVDTVTYTQVTYSGLKSTGNPGEPLLPKLFLTFSVPYDAENFEAVTSGASYTTIQLPTVILPVEQDYFINDSVIPPLTPDPAIYNSNFSFPSDFAEVLSEGYYMGENKVVTVAVSPMKYIPSNKRLRLNCSFTVTLYYDRPSGGNPPANMLVRKNQNLRQLAWDELKQRVVNPNQVEGFAIQASNSLRFPDPENQVDSVWTYGGELYDRSCEYLIVTTSELAPSFRRLAALKRQKGYTVGIRCIENILLDSRVQNGDKCAKRDGTFTYINDEAGKLREYLKYYHVNYGTKYVLLAGTGIPFRYGYGTAAENQHFHIPTDWYYCDLTTNWNINGNTYYGERLQYSPQGEVFDYDAELFVGRLMLSTEEEVKTYTNKLMTYELKPGNGESDYLDRALFVTGSQDPALVDPCLWLRDSLSSIYSNVNSIINVNTSIPTGSDIVREINQSNYGFISIIGHGSPHNICVNQPFNSNNGHYEQKHYLYSKFIDRGDPEEDCNGLDSLTNSKYPGVLYTYACDNMPFDVFTEPSNNHTYIGYNMGQEYTLGPNGGGVAYLGNTRSGYMGTSPILMRRFLEILAGGIHHVGMTEAYSKRLFGNVSKYVLMSHNLMGEPEFSIWTVSPTTFQNITVSRTNYSTTVSGLPVGEECIISLCSNSGNAITDTTTTGMLTIDLVPPNTTLMVTSKQHVPHIAPTFMQNTTIARSQYVIASDFTAGNHVDANRTAGDVVLNSGVDYVVEHSGKVVLARGFKIKKGARFSTVKRNY